MLEKVNQAPLIFGERVTLRLPKKQDIDDRFQLGRNPEVVKLFGGDTHNLREFTYEDAKAFIKKTEQNPLEWCIEYEGRWVGHARLRLDKRSNRASYSVGIFDSTVWGLGLGTEITQLVLQYAFEQLQLHRVGLRVLDFNKRAIACYEKCGFVQEGMERENVPIDGEYASDVLMGILDREYDQIKDQFNFKAVTK
ncbi:GNAT family N-acetyltransferase [Alkalibacillus haloalkaliphilus]|uniref:GNAT family N-acetyltransferase n=1 Tax=Alkalibacillus haloalkaliphilus TaxID=94136 RepID=UPI0002DC5532|nr:GNAT family protein [Alkalibacillus haloalkaliphilus]